MAICKLKIRVRCRPREIRRFFSRNLVTFFADLVTFLADLVIGSVHVGARSG